MRQSIAVKEDFDVVFLPLYPQFWLAHGSSVKEVVRLPER
jgi:hypothetical protein